MGAEPGLPTGPQASLQQLMGGKRSREVAPAEPRKGPCTAVAARSVKQPPSLTIHPTVHQNNPGGESTLRGTRLTPSPPASGQPPCLDGAFRRCGGVFDRLTRGRELRARENCAGPPPRRCRSEGACAPPGLSVALISPVRACAHGARPALAPNMHSLGSGGGPGRHDSCPARFQRSNCEWMSMVRPVRRASLAMHLESAAHHPLPAAPCHAATPPCCTSRSLRRRSPT